MGDALPGSEAPPAMDVFSDASAAPPPVAPVPVTPEPAVVAPEAAELPEPPRVAPAPKVPLPRAPLASQVSRPGLGEAKKSVLTPARPSPSIVRPSAVGAASTKAPLPAAKAPLAKSSPVKPAATPLALKSDKRSTQGVASTALPPGAPKPAVTSPTATPPAVANALAEVGAEDVSTRIADAGALAGAFSLAVGGAAGESPAAATLSMPADEWFVGINGVPVGPIRLSELRSKAVSGSVNRESLVWRDGFEDWRPLRTYPELLAIVDESLSSARATLTPFTPPTSTAFGLAAAGAALPAAALGAATADPFVAPAAIGVTGAAVVTDDLEVAGLQKRSGASPAAWIAVAMALLFGLTIGFVLFNKQQGKPTEIIKYVDRPVPGAATVSDDKQPAAVDDSTTPGETKSGTKHVAGLAKTSGAPVGTTESDKGISGLKGLSGLPPSGPRGPDASGPSGAVQGGAQLDSGQIQSTVARYTGSVKRACWQPALDTRDKDAPTTARVNVAITVMPSGSVQSAVVGGDPKGYRGLSQCISSRVHGWQFPPSGDTTTVNVPFVFAAQ
jgi:hypothetical protein